MIESAGQKPDAGFFATAAGMIFLLLGAGGVVGQLQARLIRSGVSCPNRSRDHGVFSGSFGLVLHGIGRGIFIVVSLVVSAVLTRFRE